MTTANTVVVAARVYRPTVMAMAASAPTHSTATYNGVGSSGYHDA